VKAEPVQQRAGHGWPCRSELSGAVAWRRASQRQAGARRDCL